MQEITSVNNDLVKATVKLQQKKYRDRENKFLLEGVKCVEEAFNSGLEIEYIFVLKEKSHNYKILNHSVQANVQNDVNIIYTTEQILKKISTTESAPDIVGVAYKKVSDKNLLLQSKKVVLLENIKDVGNLGTILRTSAAFGADAVVLYGKECADIYNPKCVRASVGNLWKLPIFYIENLENLKKIFGNFEKIATLPRARTYLKEFKPTNKMLVMFGSEADGLSSELVKFSSKELKIEMANNVESLNLSVSCSIVLYELFL